MRFVLVLGLLLTAFVQTTHAADLGGANRYSVKDEASYLSGFNWTGGYAGAHIGYAWSKTEASTGPLSGFNQTFDYDDSGFLGGIHGGYNFQRGSFVYGIEADIDFADIDATEAGSLGTATHQTEINWSGSLRARVGWAMDRTLFYVTGGWAFADVDTTQSNISGPPLTVETSEFRNGWTIGGGVERAFSDKLTARLEYRYTDLGVTEVEDNVINQRDENDITLHTIRAGISYKF